MSENIDYEDIYDNVHYITDEVDEFQHGVVFSCLCGQDFGREFGEKIIDCVSCDRVLIDEKADEREPPERDDDQAGLGDFA